MFDLYFIHRDEGARAAYRHFCGSGRASVSGSMDVGVAHQERCTTRVETRLLRLIAKAGV